MSSIKFILSALSVSMLLIGYGIGQYTSQSNIAELKAAKSREINELQSLLEARQATIEKVEQQATVADKNVERIHNSDAGHDLGEGALVRENIAADTDTQENIQAEAGDMQAVLSDVNQLIADVEMQTLIADGINEDTRDRLTKLIAQDPFSQERLLQAYLDNPLSASGESLRLILGEFRDENIEQAAIGLTVPGNEAAVRLAGLELLQQMGIENTETLEVALNIVTEEIDNQLVSAALDTLQFQTVSPAQGSRIKETILPRLSDADAEVRRRGVIAYSDWVTSPDAAAPIISALNDPSVDVRVGAAYAMSNVSAKSPEMRDALIRKVVDDDEDWQVREQAWHALEQHDMNEVSHQIYTDFKNQLDAHGESIQ